MTPCSSYKGEDIPGGSQKVAILVASGSGSRMGAAVPKQFLPLCGKPVLVHTVEKFLAVERCEIVLALAAEGMKQWEAIAQEFLPGVPLSVVEGGETRFHSVQRAVASLTQLDGRSLVAVHDGVRPFVPVEVIQRTYAGAMQYGAAVACVPSKDSLRIIGAEGNRSLEREAVRLVQTPQAFRLDILRQAYAVDYDPLFTDDASVVERLGYSIQLVEGSYANLKITTPEDLRLGAALLEKR